MVDCFLHRLIAECGPAEYLWKFVGLGHEEEIEYPLCRVCVTSWREFDLEHDDTVTYQVRSIPRDRVAS